MDIMTIILSFLIVPVFIITIYKVYYCSKKCKISNNKICIFECIKSCNNPSASDDIIKKIMDSKNEIIDDIFSEDDDFYHIKSKNVK